MEKDKYYQPPEKSTVNRNPSDGAWTGSCYNFTKIEGVTVRKKQAEVKQYKLYFFKLAGCERQNSSMASDKCLTE